VEGYSGVLRDEVGGSSDTARWVPSTRPWTSATALRRKALTELRP